MKVEKVSARPTSPHATATMRANRGRDTAPELALRSALHRRGLRFRKNLRIDLEAGRVRPDIVFPRRKLAVFVDGCFWHGCPDHGELPASNVDFWRSKINATRQRDARHSRLLSQAGWKVIRVWEHEPLDTAVARIRQAAADPQAAPDAGLSSR